MKTVSIDLERLRGVLYGNATRVSKALGFSRQAISKKLNGHIPLTLDDLNKICKAVGRDPSEFIKYTECEDS